MEGGRIRNCIFTVLVLIVNANPVDDGAGSVCPLGKLYVFTFSYIVLTGFYYYHVRR